MALQRKIRKSGRCKGIWECAEKLLVVTKLEGDNQGGEKIQGILEEINQRTGFLRRGENAYFQVWPPSFCDLHHMGGSRLGSGFWHGWGVDGLDVDLSKLRGRKWENVEGEKDGGRRRRRRWMRRKS